MLQNVDSSATAFREPAYALLRIVSGLAFALHGVEKIFGWPNLEGKKALFTQVGIGGVIELLCGLLMAFGLLTRPAAFLASGTMAVAYIQFHWKLQFVDDRWLPAVNQGELALIYCFLFLYIFTRGAGIASMDKRAS